jgi:hypothetical protein
VFRAAYFSPTFSKYNGTTVAGAQWFESSHKCGQSLQSQVKGMPTSTTNIAGDRGNGRGSFPDMSSIFTQATAILLALKGLSDPPESFVWDGSWFGHPGSELIDQYAGRYFPWHTPL